MTKPVVGIIGGSGFYRMEGFSFDEEVEITTPFGKPSDRFILGEIKGVSVAFLSRHGKGHKFSPSEINYRANIYGMKKLGVKSIISVSAVGSLKEEIKPGDMVIPDQIVDFTKGLRKYTFFENGIVAHVQFGTPYCPNLSSILYQAAKKLGITTHYKKTLVVIEGPQFSTQAESFLYRKLGFDIIGMTASPEARLAREAEICYQTLAMATDYDCWHDSEDEVNVTNVVEILNKNIIKAKNILSEAILNIAKIEDCACRHALEGAIITDSSLFNEEIKEKYNLFWRK